MSEKNDYFEGEFPEELPKVETPQEKEEKEIAANTIEVRGRKRKRFFRWVKLILALGVCVWIWLTFFNPYAESEKTGRLMEVKLEGHLLKTYEGEMISEEYVYDTTKVFQRDFTFSIADDSVALDLMKLKGSGRKITVSYIEYKGKLPWRGETNRIVTGYEVE